LPEDGRRAVVEGRGVTPGLPEAAAGSPIRVTASLSTGSIGFAEIPMSSGL
jgi:hypothetical protein